MRDALFDQAEADRQVLISMNQQIIKILRGLEKMPLLQLANGQVIRVENFEVVSPEQLQQMLTEAQARVSELQSFTQAAPAVDQGQPAQDPAQAAPAAPAQPADATQPTVDPNAVQPAPVDQAQQAPDPAVPPLQ